MGTEPAGPAGRGKGLLCVRETAGLRGEMGYRSSFPGVHGETGLKKALGRMLPSAVIRGRLMEAWTGWAEK